LIKGAIESVLLGRQPAGAALKAANDRVNRLFGHAAGTAVTGGRP
jgi:hypothetical protein